MKIAAIILSYKRQQNIAKIAEYMNRCDFISDIFLSNNNPELDINDWGDFSGDKYHVVNQVMRCYPSKRLEIAEQCDADYFLCCDDDLFLSTSQLNQFITVALQAPSKVHGIYGQVFVGDGVGARFYSGISGVNLELDVLNRAYFFSKSHVRTMGKLASQMGFACLDDVRYIDDLVMSFSGDGRPLCHDVGPIEDCETSLETGIATCMQDGFDEPRMEAYVKLSTMTDRH